MHPNYTENYNQVEGAVTIKVSPKVVNATVTVVGGNFVSNGSEQKPGLTVKDGETTFAIAKKASSALSGVEREFMRTIATTGNEIDVEAMLPDDHGTVTYTITNLGYTVLENEQSHSYCSTQ